MLSLSSPLSFLDILSEVEVLSLSDYVSPSLSSYDPAVRTSSMVLSSARVCMSCLQKSILRFDQERWARVATQRITSCGIRSGVQVLVMNVCHVVNGINIFALLISCWAKGNSSNSPTDHCVIGCGVYLYICTVFDSAMALVADVVPSD